MTKLNRLLKTLIAFIAVATLLAVETPTTAQQVPKKVKRTKLTRVASDCSNVPPRLKFVLYQKGLCHRKGSGGVTPNNTVEGDCGAFTLTLDPLPPDNAEVQVIAESYLGPISSFTYYNTVTNRTNGLQFDYTGPAAPDYEGEFAGDTQQIQPYAGYVEVDNEYALVFVNSFGFIPIPCFSSGASDQALIRGNGIPDASGASVNSLAYNKGGFVKDQKALWKRALVLH